MRELDVQAVPEKLPEVLQFVSESLVEIGCKDKERNEIEIAVEEIFTNIAGYAYDPAGPAIIRVELSDNPLTVSLSFIDEGKPYDPLAKPDPNVKLSLKERSRGGLGIFMTKKFMDEVEYDYKDGRNVLTLRKMVLRQPEVDLTKAFITFFLATIHVFVECSTDDQLWSGLPYFFDSILGGPWAAPMFIFSMGIGLAFTTRNKPVDLFVRGVKILMVGLILNVMRFLVPSLLGFMITKDQAFYIDKLPYRFFGNDLLQFAGLAMIFMALLKYFKLTPWKIFGIGLVMNGVAWLLRGTWLDNIMVNILLGHFIGVDNGTELVMSDFPLLVWFLMYASGLVFGGYLKVMTPKAKKKFYMLVSLPCFIVTTAVYIIEYYMGFGMMGGPGANVFYHLTTPEVFLCIGTEFAMLGLCYFICSKCSKRVLDVIEKISRSVTVVYVIQWTLVWWVANVLIYIVRGSKYLPPLVSLGLGLVLSTASVVIAQFWMRFKKKRKISGIHGL